MSGFPPPPPPPALPEHVPGTHAHNQPKNEAKGAARAQNSCAGGCVCAILRGGRPQKGGWGHHRKGPQGCNSGHITKNMAKYQSLALVGRLSITERPKIAPHGPRKAGLPWPTMCPCKLLVSGSALDPVGMYHEWVCRRLRLFFGPFWVCFGQMWATEWTFQGALASNPVGLVFSCRGAYHTHLGPVETFVLRY